MRVGIIGATGFVGKALCAALSARGDEVVAFGRSAARVRAALPKAKEAWSLDEINVTRVATLDAVVNLAGESVAAKRWSAAQKAAIRDSRLRTTRRVVDAIAGASRRPRVLINASAVGYYGPHGDEEVTEATPAGHDFLAGVCREWEAEAVRVVEHGVREVRLRTGLVLGDAGGPLEQMLLPFKLFVGGPVGDGRQWFPWVHLDDVVGAIGWALDHQSVQGPINVTAPNPVRFGELAKALGRRLHRPAWIPVPEFALRIAVGEMAEVLVTGQRAVPTALRESGYAFRYERLDEALADAVRT